MVIHAPLKVTGDYLVSSRLLALTSKASGTIFENEFTLEDRATGAKAVSIVSRFFAVGMQGMADLGVSSIPDVVIPGRSADATVRQTTQLNQALLYRMTGDTNPLHGDDAVAKSFGFDRAILHGMCTLGFAVRHVMQEYGDNKSESVRSVRCRFSRPVYPGNTLVTQMWKSGEISKGIFRIIFNVKVEENGGIVVIDKGFVDIADLSSRL